MESYLVFLVCALLISVSLESNKDYFSRIDNLLYEKISYPVVGEGERLIDSLIVFNNEFNHSIQVYKFNRTGQDVVDMLISTNGPRCIKVYPNDTLLLIVYEWGIKELGELYYFLNQAKNSWRDFRYYLVTDLHYDIAPMPRCQDEHWGVSDYLKEVDDSISGWLKDPSLNSKKEIFEMVGDYLETLQDFIEKIDLRRKTALIHGEILLKRKQPRYLDIPFPEDVLKADYNWREVDVDDYKRLLRETDLLWQDFEKSFADMKKAVSEGEEPTSDKSAGFE